MVHSPSFDVHPSLLGCTPKYPSDLIVVYDNGEIGIVPVNYHDTMIIKNMSYSPSLQLRLESSQLGYCPWLLTVATNATTISEVTNHLMTAQ